MIRNNRQRGREYQDTDIQDSISFPHINYIDCVLMNILNITYVPKLWY